MKIGELARRASLATSCIRFYERIGLLTALRQANGYRSYPEEAVLTLRLITAAQQAGFSLDEMRALLPSGRASWEHGTLIGALRRKVEEIDALQTQLAETRTQLRELMVQIEVKPSGMDCAANAKRVLSEMQLGMEDVDTPPGPYGTDLRRPATAMRG